MGKQPVVARQDTRYEPYSKASLARRRRGSPPPGGWGILAGSRQAQLTGDICNLLDDLDKRYGGRDLRELFRDHANPPGALGQAIKTWISYDEVIILLISSSLWVLRLACCWLIRYFRFRGLASQNPPTFWMPAT